MSTNANKPDLITFQVTTVNRKRLTQELERLRALEGAKAAPARVMNKLMADHLAPCPDEVQVSDFSIPITPPNGSKTRKKPRLAQSA